MDIKGIEARRQAADLTQKDLCEKAGVNETTYTAIKRGHRGGYARTFDRLTQALDEVEKERAQ